MFEKSEKVRKNDIVMTLTGENKDDISKGLVYLENEEIAIGGDIMCFSNHIMNPLYLVYVLNSSYYVSIKKNLHQAT